MVWGEELVSVATAEREKEAFGRRRLCGRKGRELKKKCIRCSYKWRYVLLTVRGPPLMV
ncbi:unnamed protein product [Larinioides sclopetarius]|uniref:Ribosomal protein S14 n=1 Tax=Larinioides sclopetarius TaxID=280406 RepID=A0AAV2A4M3_9ARAC